MVVHINQSFAPGTDRRTLSQAATDAARVASRIGREERLMSDQDDVRELLQQIVREEITTTMREELREFATSMPDALAVLASMMMRASKLKRGPFVEAARAASAALRAEGKEFAAAVVNGMCDRIR